MNPAQVPVGFPEAAQELVGSPEAFRAGEDLEAARRPILAPAGESEVAAVDGGSSLLLDLATCGIVTVRAGWTRRRPGDQFDDVVPIARARTVRRQKLATQWSDVLREHGWGLSVEAPAIRGGQSLRAWADAERTLAEFDAARRALRTLPEGSLLLLDGSLEPEGSAALPLEALLARARDQRVCVVGFTKDSSRSFSGTLPFTLEVEDWARRTSWPASFFVDATKLLGRPCPDARTYAARFAPHGRVYRVDVDAEGGEPPGEVFAQLQALCNDPAYPGYPYALARIHELVHYSDSESSDLRRNLEALVSERRGSLLGMRMFGRGRDVLALGG